MISLIGVGYFLVITILINLGRLRRSDPLLGALGVCREHSIFFSQWHDVEFKICRWSVLPTRPFRVIAVTLLDQCHRTGYLDIRQPVYRKQMPAQFKVLLY